MGSRPESRRGRHGAMANRGQIADVFSPLKVLHGLHVQRSAIGRWGAQHNRCEVDASIDIRDTLANLGKDLRRITSRLARRNSSGSSARRSKISGRVEETSIVTAHQRRVGV